jgi:hypothetical protein
MNIPLARWSKAYYHNQSDHLHDAWSLASSCLLVLFQFYQLLKGCFRPRYHLI